MDDLISRRLAIAVIADYERDSTAPIDYREIIEALPSEGQEITKCGHCRYWGRLPNKYTQGVCDIWKVKRVRRDFCSEGRPRDGKADGTNQD